MTRIILFEIWLAGAVILLMGMFTSSIFGGGKKYRELWKYAVAVVWPIALFSSRGRKVIGSIFGITQE